MQYIRNKTTGAVYTATERLIKLAEDRKDLEVTDEAPKPTGRKARKAPKEAPKKAEPVTEPEPEPEPEPDEDEPGPDIAELIKGTKGKDKIHSLVLENYGVDLDRRKKLDTLKAEALQIIAEQED